MSIEFHRAWSMPHSDTFSVRPIGEFVRKWLTGKTETVDPFARNSTLAKYRNDLNPKTAAESHLQADEFLLGLVRAGVMADVILLDPPYSPRQISECYKEAGLTAGMKDTQNARLYREIKDAAHKLALPGTIVLSFGWNSSGMGKERGYVIREILMVCHGGAHNDTICMAEERINDRQADLNLCNHSNPNADGLREGERK